ncbi:reverse transcriptase domain-containing protein [Tanacetum coccineum]
MQIIYRWKLRNNEGSELGLIPDSAPVSIVVEYSYALRLNFSNSNNEAEYEALLAGLRIAKEMQVRDIHAFVDSKLVASQSRERKGRCPYKQVVDVKFDTTLSKKDLVEVLNECSVEAQEVNMVVEEEGSTWMTPIQNYLEDGKLPEDLVDARTLMEKIRNYTIEDGVLYRKSYLVSTEELSRILCQRADQSKHDDATHAAVPRLPKADMISVTSAWPFMKWGMDIVGPLPKGPGRVKYLIVAIDYFTKWMEAKPLDNRTQFVNDLFKKWAGKLMIQLISTSVYHPRGNRVVERANKSLLRGIKTRLEKGGSTWAEEVPNVLWAHRTMKKTSNGETTFSLTYGTEAVIPAEIGMLNLN